MPDLPEPIGTVTFRLFGGDEDFPGMVAVLHGTAAADGVDRHDTVEDMRRVYSTLSNCDLETDVLIAEADGRLVAYSRVFWWVEQPSGDRIYLQFGWVLPEYRGQGVGTAMLRWCEERLREIASEHPDTGARFLQSFYDEGESTRQEVLEAEGYAATEFFAEMVRDLSKPIPDLELPDGLEIRPVTRDDYRRIYEADVDAFRDHIGYSDPTAEDWEEWRTSPHRQPELWKVAFDGDRIAGQVLNYVAEGENTEKGRNRGHTEYISVQRPYRGRGVAKKLIADSMIMLRDMGMEEAALGVHTTNPTGAFQLYSGLGYEVVSTSVQMRKQL